MKQFLSHILVTVAAVFAELFSASTAAAAKPNILYIIGEQLSWPNMASCYSPARLTASCQLPRHYCLVVETLRILSR